MNRTPLTSSRWLPTPIALPHHALGQRALRPDALRRSAGAIVLAGLLFWTALFLGVHELKHIGQLDSSSCPIALIAATHGSASVQAGFALAPPPAAPSQYIPTPVRPVQGFVPTAQARGPPVQA